MELIPSGRRPATPTYEAGVSANQDVPPTRPPPRHSRRQALLAFGVATGGAIAGLALNACAGTGSPSSTTVATGPAKPAPATTPTSVAAAPVAATAPTKSTFQGTITFYGGNYTPQPVTKTNPHPTTYLNKIVADYEKLHPGVKISLVPPVPPTADYYTWYQTKSTGGQLPDVVFNQHSIFNSMPAGEVVDLRPYLNQPNPYVKGNAKWNDIFDPVAEGWLVAPGGALYMVDIAYVGTEVIFSKPLFKQAGIEKPPTTWKELMDACAKIKKIGVIPWGEQLFPDSFGGNLGWYSRLFCTEFYYNDWRKLDADKTIGFLSPLDTLVAFKKGLFGLDEPRWMESWWTMLKEFTQYWQPGFVSNSVSKEQLFIQKKVAMYFGASSEFVNLKALKVPFEWGAFPFPNVTTESSKYSANKDVSGAVGGPDFGWGVPTHAVDNAMTPQKMDAVIDWLMYLTAPQNAGPLVNDVGYDICTVKGAVIPDNMTLLTKEFKDTKISIDGGYLDIPAIANQINRVYSSYLLGSIDMPTVKTQMKPIVDSFVAQLSKKYTPDQLAKYLK